MMLPAYASAMRCTYGVICLQACYAMSGTDLAYGATQCQSPYASKAGHGVTSRISLRACYAMSGTDIAYAATSPSRPGGAACAYGAMRCAVLIKCMVCGAMRRAVLSTRMLYGAVRCAWLLSAAYILGYLPPIPLRSAYAVSGTELAYAAMLWYATCLRPSYPMSDTDIAYGVLSTGVAVRCLVLTLAVCYQNRGIRLPSVPRHQVLRLGRRVSLLLSCYALARRYPVLAYRMPGHRRMHWERRLSTRSEFDPP
eukprot:3878628-Rhodomonas_salina.2